MSLKLAAMRRSKAGKMSREQVLKLAPALEYNDGRTKQSHKDETDIVKIMARFDQTGTISHLEKYEGVYADFSDFDFHAQSNRLAEGQSIFDALPAELRQEFGQSAGAFFAYVNDPVNHDNLRAKLPALAQPGRQIPLPATPDADTEAALAAAKQVIEAPPKVEPSAALEPPPES